VKHNDHITVIGVTCKKVYIQLWTFSLIRCSANLFKQAKIIDIMLHIDK